MFTTSTIFLVLSASLCIGQASAAADAQLGIGQSAFDLVVTAFEPLLVQKIQSTQIPDESVDSDHVHVDLSRIHIDQVTCMNCASMKLNPPGLVVAISGLKVVLSAHAHVKWSIFHVDCDIDATASPVSAVTRATVGDDSGHIHLSSTSVSVDLGEFNVNIHGGGLAGDIVKLVVKIFKHQIGNQVSAAIDSAVRNLINDDANKAIASLPDRLTIPSGKDPIADLSVAITSSPVVSSSLLSAFVSGAVSPGSAVRNLPPPPNYPAVRLPPVTPRDMVTLLVSQNPFSELLWIFAAGGLLSKEVFPYAVAKAVNLSTYDLGYIAPALYTQYPNMYMIMNVSAAAEFGNVTDAPRVTFAPGSNTMSLALILDFQVVLAGNVSTGPPAPGTVKLAPAFTVACPASATTALNVSVVNDSITVVPSVSALSCSVSLLHTAVGEVHTDLLDLFVDIIFSRVGIDFINKELARGFLVPAIPQLTPERASVVYADGYMQLSGSFKPRSML